ncbi:MAG: hypothetical protein ACHP9Z_29090 [Streptosporangiales bacterium]
MPLTVTSAGRTDAKHTGPQEPGRPVLRVALMGRAFLAAIKGWISLMSAPC